MRSTLLRAGANAVDSLDTLTVTGAGVGDAAGGLGIDDCSVAVAAELGYVGDCIKLGKLDGNPGSCGDGSNTATAFELDEADLDDYVSEIFPNVGPSEGNDKDATMSCICCLP